MLFIGNLIMCVNILIIVFVIDFIIFFVEDFDIFKLFLISCRCVLVVMNCRKRSIWISGGIGWFLVVFVFRMLLILFMINRMVFVENLYFWYIFFLLRFFRGLFKFWKIWGCFIEIVFCFLWCWCLIMVVILFVWENF